MDRNIEFEFLMAPLLNVEVNGPNFDTVTLVNIFSFTKVHKRPANGFNEEWLEQLLANIATVLRYWSSGDHNAHVVVPDELKTKARRILPSLAP
jgi:hypothetical protein